MSRHSLQLRQPFWRTLMRYDARWALVCVIRSTVRRVVGNWDASEIWMSIGAVFGAPVAERVNPADAEEHHARPKELP